MSGLSSFLLQKTPPPSWLSAVTDKANFRSMALFRILFALLLLCDFVFNIHPYYNDFFGPHGFMPYDLWWEKYGRWPGYFSILTFSDAPAWHTAIQLIYAVALIAFLFGYRTRWANFIILIIYSSLMERNPLLQANIETLSRGLLVFSLFLPLNRYWSFDSALETQDRRRPWPVIPLIAVKLQISMIYLFSGLFKIPTGSPWLQGKGVEMALADDIFAQHSGTVLIHAFPALAHFAGYAIPFFQITFVFLVYCPVWNNLTRLIAIIGAVVMHASFILLMNVGYFPYLCLVYLVLLIPDDWWNAWTGMRRAKLAAMRIFYDPDCLFCRKTALLLREFCLDEQVPVLPSSSDPQADTLLRQYNSWIVYGADGKIHLKWDAVAHVFRQSRIFFILGFAGNDRLYDLIGRSRPALGKFTAALLPWRTEKILPASMTGICLLLMVTMLTFSFMELPQAGRKTPHWLKDTSLILQVQQSWGIFANPVTRERVINFYALKANGDTVNVRNIISLPFTFDPQTRKWTFPNHRYIKFFEKMLEKKGAPDWYFRQGYMAYLCNKANAAIADPDQKVARIFLYHERRLAGVSGKKTQHTIIRDQHICRKTD